MTEVKQVKDNGLGGMIQELSELFNELLEDYQQSEGALIHKCGDKDSDITEMNLHIKNYRRRFGEIIVHMNQVFRRNKE